MTAPGGRGEVPTPSSLPRRRSIAVSDVMSGGDGPSRSRHVGDSYPPLPPQHAPAVTQHSHNARATPPPTGPPLPPPPPPAHLNPPSSFPYRRDLSPDGSRGRTHSSSSSNSPRYPQAHAGPTTGFYVGHTAMYEGNPNHLQHHAPPRHRTDLGEELRSRDYPRPPYDRRGVPGDNVEREDPRRFPYPRYDYGRDYPPQDRPPREGKWFPSPPPPRFSVPLTASGPSASPHELAPHAYPISARGLPSASLTHDVAEANYISGGPITNSPSGTAGSPSSAFEAQRGVETRPRSPLPGSAPLPRDARSRGGRDDLARGRPMPPHPPQ